jgi:hypothetical protein
MDRMQIRDLMTDHKELEHRLKLQQMEPEVAKLAKRMWAMNEESNE